MNIFKRIFGRRHEPQPPVMAIGNAFAAIRVTRKIAEEAKPEIKVEIDGSMPVSEFGRVLDKHFPLKDGSRWGLVNVADSPDLLRRQIAGEA